MVSAQARREQVDYAVSRGTSVRRSCALMNVSRSALEYVSTMPARDAVLTAELKELAAANPAYGHRFAWGVLTRQRHQRVNRKRVRRLWRALGLSVRRRKHRKIRTGQPRALAPTGPNQVWAYDFVHDTCGNGQTIKALAVIDEWTRESLAIEVDSKLDAARVIRVLERLFETYGTPAVLRSDNGPEFIARALRIWAMMKHSDIATIEPGKPWQNGSIESFNGTLRLECLDRECFAHLREAKIVIEQWRWEYDTKRPHSSLGYRTPAEVGTEARAAVTQESNQNEIAAHRASCEAAAEQNTVEVHHHDGEPVITVGPRNGDSPEARCKPEIGCHGASGGRSADWNRLWAGFAGQIGSCFRLGAFWKKLARCGWPGRSHRVSSSGPRGHESDLGGQLGLVVRRCQSEVVL